MTPAPPDHAMPEPKVFHTLVGPDIVIEDVPEAARRDAAMQQKVREYAVALAIATRGDSSAALRKAEEWLRSLLSDTEASRPAPSVKESEPTP